MSTMNESIPPAYSPISVPANAPLASGSNSPVLGVAVPGVSVSVDMCPPPSWCACRRPYGYGLRRSWGVHPIFDGRPHQAVFRGEQAGPGPIGDAELGVDVLDVVARRLAGDHQAFADL